MTKEQITKIFGVEFKSIEAKPLWYEYHYKPDKEWVAKLFKYADSCEMRNDDLEFRFELEDRIWIPYLKIFDLGFKPSIGDIKKKLGIE